MVGAVVLAAATAAAGKLAELREAEQDYLNVASAAQMVKDRICVSGYTYTKKSNEINPTVKFSASDGKGEILRDELIELCNILTDPIKDQNTRKSELEGKKIPFEINGNLAPGVYDEKWKTVNGSLSMKVDGRIIVELWLGNKAEGKSHNNMEIEFCPDGPVTKTIVDTVIDSGESGGDVVEIYTYVAMCSWPEEGCTITKGIQ